MSFSLNPKKIAHSLAQAPHKALEVAKDAVEIAKDVPGVVKESAEDVYKAGKYLADNPPNLGQVKRTTLALGHAIASGERTRIVGNMPAYAKLDPLAKAEAVQRGAGREIEQRYISSNKEGTQPHEPVNLVVRGSKEQLVEALRAQGWMKAPDREAKNFVKMGAKVLFGTEKDTNGPVSAMHLDGREEAMAFNKNDDYNAGRDHMRVFHKGTDPKTGEDIWEVAATRDIAATVTVPHPQIDLSLKDGLHVSAKAPGFGHETDHHIDGERDLIMHDLLASGRVSAWAAVDGKRQGMAEARNPDGTLTLGNKYVTDGKVYELTLGG